MSLFKDENGEDEEKKKRPNGQNKGGDKSFSNSESKKAEDFLNEIINKLFANVNADIDGDLIKEMEKQLIFFESEETNKQMQLLRRKLAEYKQFEQITGEEVELPKELQIDILQAIQNSQINNLNKFEFWLDYKKILILTKDNLNIIDGLKSTSRCGFKINDFGWLSSGNILEDALFYDYNNRLKVFSGEYVSNNQQKKVAIVPADVYSFAQCIEYCDLGGVDEIVGDGGLDIRRYAEKFGWSKTDGAKLMRRAIERKQMLERSERGRGNNDDNCM